MNSTVQVLKQEIVVPTYETGKPEKIQCFWKNGADHGSISAVYPRALIERNYDEKINERLVLFFPINA